MVSGQRSVNAASNRASWLRRMQAEANQAENLLVATEEAGAKARRQNSPIAPRAHEAVQPALGQMRIGFVPQHR